MSDWLVVELATAAEEGGIPIQHIMDAVDQNGDYEVTMQINGFEVNVEAFLANLDQNWKSSLQTIAAQMNQGAAILNKQRKQVMDEIDAARRMLDLTYRSLETSLEAGNERD